MTYRYLRHYNMISIAEFQEETMYSIFGSLVDWWMKRCKYGEEIAQCTNKLISASLTIYNKARLELLPTPAKSHYTFNLRDLSKIFQVHMNGSRLSMPFLSLILLLSHLFAALRLLPRHLLPGGASTPRSLPETTRCPPGNAKCVGHSRGLPAAD